MDLAFDRSHDRFGVLPIANGKGQGLFEEALSLSAHSRLSAARQVVVRQVPLVAFLVLNADLEDL